MKLQDPASHPAILKACEDLTYEFLCGGNDLPYLQDIFAAGQGSTAKLSSMPNDIIKRLNKSLGRRDTDKVAIKEIPKYFPGVKVTAIDDTPDRVAEGGRLLPQFKKLFKAGQAFNNKSEILAYEDYCSDSAWLFVHADTSVDLEKLTQFIEVNVPRWEYFYRCEQLPGDGNAANRKHPLSVIPGSEAAKLPVDDGIPERENVITWKHIGGGAYMGTI